MAGQVAKFYTKVRLGDQEKAWAAKVVPDYQIIGGVEPHPHPLLHLERNVSEDILVRSLGASAGQYALFDVGGSPCRHHAKGRRIEWSACPILDLADVQRETDRQDYERSKKVKLRYCNDRVLECKHLDAVCRTSEVVLLMVDSVYYFGPDDVATLVNKPGVSRLYISAHHFEGLAGELYGEAQWTRIGDTLKMVVRGNMHPYEHKDISWLDRGCYAGPGGKMVWRVMREVGAHRLYQVEAAPAASIPVAPAVRTVTVREALRDVLYKGAVDTTDLRGLMARSELVITDVQSTLETLATAQAYAAPGLLVWRIKGEVVELPVSLVSAARWFVSTKPRTPEVLRATVEHVKAMAPKVNVPLNKVAPLITYIAVLGFSIDVEAELGLLRGLALTKAAVFKEHGDALGLLRPAGWLLSEIWCWCKRVGVATASVVGLVGAFLAWRRLRRRPTMSWFHVLYGWVRWLCRLFSDRRPSCAAGSTVVRTVPVERFETVCQASKALPRVRDGATYDDSAAVYQCEPTFGYSMVGWMAPVCLPVVPRSCACNENVGLRCRFFMPSPEPLAGEWDKAFEMACSANLLRELWRVPVEAVPYEEWEGHFEPQRRRQIADARDQVVNLRRVVSNARQAFVKRELLPKWVANSDLDFKPRIVLESDTVYQQETGPWCYALSHRLGEAWGVDQHPEWGVHFTYAAGMTLEGITEWVVRAAMRYAEPLFVSMDKTSWDGTLPEAALNVEMEIYAKCCCPASVLRLLVKQRELVGHSKHGIKFRRKGARATGVNNTSCGNTLLDGLSVVYWLCHAGVSVLDASVLVMGDDVVVVTQARHEARLRDAESRFTDLGLINKSRYSRSVYDVEFCSKVAYPTADGSGIMFGPKIGRILCKTGMCKLDLSPVKLKRWLRGVVEGIERDVGFIPILRALVWRALRDTQGLDPIYEPRRQYQIHAESHHVAGDLAASVMETRYGVAWDEILALEAKIRATATPMLIESAVVDRVMAIDCPSARQEIDPLCDWLSVITRALSGVCDPRVWSVVGAPLFEEWAKRAHPWLASAVCCAEAAANWYLGCGGWQVLMALLAHYAFGCMHPVMGVIGHALWNAGSV